MTVRELISKEKAVSALRENIWDPNESDSAVSTIEALPDETRRVFWVKTKADMIAVKDESKVWWRCSCCNNPALMGRLTAYCPNCGAMMAVKRS